MRTIKSKKLNAQSNLFTLAFSGDLEKAYRENHYKNSLNHVRFSLLLAIFFYGIFGILDHWVMPEVENELWLIRFGFFCPYVLVIFILSYTNYFKRLMQLSIFSVILFAGIGIIAMIMIAPYPGHSSYYTGLILVFLYGYTFFKIRFIWATLAGWSIVVAYEIAAIMLTKTPLEILINNNFFFLSGNIIGMIAGYSIEYYSRRDFLQTRMLETEKGKVEEARRYLEKRVDERTQQLVKVNEELIERITKQKITEEALKRKVSMEGLLTTLSTQFIHLRYDELEVGMKSTVNSIGEFTAVDHSFLYLVQKPADSNSSDLKLFCKWTRHGIDDRNTDYLSADFPWIMGQLATKNTVHIERMSDLPKEAGKDLEKMRISGVKSLLAVPLLFKNTFTGFIGFDMISNEHKWGEETISLLKIVGDLLVLAYERKKTEEMLRQSEEQYRTLFEKSSDVVFISTPDGRFIDINHAGLELFGYATKDEIIAIDIARELYTNATDREKYRAIIDREGQIKDFEVKLKNKNGEEIIALETTTGIRDINGNVVEYQGIIRDITKKRKLENQLFQSQKMDSIGMLAGGIAHDFNNILTALRGYADLALMKIAGESPIKNEITGISRGVERAEDLTRQLLAFGRKQIIEPRVININSVIMNLEKMMIRLIGEDINLKTVLSEDIDHIKADPGQIEQILVNLVINARDAINQKDGHTADKKITIETKQVYLDFNYVVNHPEVMVGDYLQIAVSDTGIGMSDEIQLKIFEPFYTTKSPGKGTGLGLSTVYGIVKQNKGNIYVYSEIKKGSTFKIYWPTTDLDLATDYTKETNDEIAQGEETILFVEDDCEVRKFVCDALKSLNYTVIEAANGVEALDIVKQNNIQLDLLITDVIMPEMGGEELVKEIVKFVPGLKILFTSGYTDNHIVRSGRLNEGLHFLQKPFSIKEISRKIRSIMEN